MISPLSIVTVTLFKASREGGWLGSLVFRVSRAVLGPGHPLLIILATSGMSGAEDGPAHTVAAFYTVVPIFSTGSNRAMTTISTTMARITSSSGSSSRTVRSSFRQVARSSESAI